MDIEQHVDVPMHLVLLGCDQDNGQKNNGVDKAKKQTQQFCMNCIWDLG